jgi:hypothetical protein
MLPLHKFQRQPPNFNPAKMFAALMFVFVIMAFMLAAIHVWLLAIHIGQHRNLELFLTTSVTAQNRNTQ